MQPIPETAQALDELGPAPDGEDLRAPLTRLAQRARSVVSDLVGVSVAKLDSGLTFTLVASDEDAAALDGVQYAAAGPCVDSAHAGEVRELEEHDVLDEVRWHLFAQATAARGVRSTLTLPVLADGRVEGTINLYAASPQAFDGHHAALAEVFGAWAAGAVVNADLGFLTRREARATPQRISDLVDAAVAVLAADLDVDVDVAEERLERAALRAGVSLVDLAEAILDADRRRPDPE
jgi:GAF domain-containing protein